MSSMASQGPLTRRRSKLDPNRDALASLFVVRRCWMRDSHPTSSPDAKLGINPHPGDPKTDPIEIK